MSFNEKTLGEIATDVLFENDNFLLIFNKIMQNKKYVRLLSLKYRLINSKVVKIINE